jgi:hypothetical protein
MKELKTRFFTEFLPTLRENAVVVAIQKAVALMDDSLKQVRTYWTYWRPSGDLVRTSGDLVET